MYLLPSGSNLGSNVSDAQINRGPLWAKISWCSPWSRPLIGSAESERPWLTKRWNYFGRIATYVITIHQRYRRTDRQTTCDRKTALCTAGHFLSKIRHYANERRRREDRGADGAEGLESGEGCPPPQPTRGLGSVVSSPSGVRGRAPAANEFVDFLYMLTQQLLRWR